MLMTAHSGSSSLGNARNICSGVSTAQLPELLEIRACQALLLISTSCGDSQLEHLTFQASSGGTRESSKARLVIAVTPDTGTLG